MGMLNFLKDKHDLAGKQNAIAFPAVLGASVEGMFVPMRQIPDEVFSTGILGNRLQQERCKLTLLSYVMPETRGGHVQNEWF